MMVLEKGRVPAWVVIGEIRSFLAQYEDDEIVEGLVEGVALKAQISPDTINTWLWHERVKSIEFDVADRIMLYVVGSTWGHDPRFEEYYLAVNLNFKKCECPGCETMIEVVRRTASGGGVVAKYCSRTCRQVAYQMRKGTRHSRQKRHFTGMAKCRRGHPRTQENSKKRPDGRVECMTCARENMRARRAAAKVFA